MSISNSIQISWRGFDKSRQAAFCELCHILLPLTPKSLYRPFSGDYRRMTCLVIIGK